MQYFENKNGKIIVSNMIKCIQDNKEYLSEIDGAIGDGDHGINMNKGFTICEERIADKDIGFSEALDTLGNVLFMEIGGSMGPLYGTLFMDMAEAINDEEVINKKVFSKLLSSGVNGIKDIVDAQVGDKTIIDALEPARDAFSKAVDEDKSFEEALQLMKVAAEVGKESTLDLVAKFGRASRLGERSRGVLDAGATSCCLLLKTIADSSIKLLVK